MGYKVYVRDNTASNIPALYIYIPGMSTPYVDADHFSNNNRFFFETDLSGLGRISSSNPDEIERLFKSLVKIPYKNLLQIDLSPFAFYQKSSDMRSLNILQLVMMLAYRTGDYDTTIALLKVLSANAGTNKRYFSIAAKFVFLKKNGCDLEDIRKILCRSFDNRTVNEVISDFNNPLDIFKDHKLPNGLSSMELSELTEGIELLRIIDSLNEKFKEMMIRQKDILEKIQ